MNNATQINDYYQRVNQFLLRKQLKQALDELDIFVKDVPEWDLHNEFEDIQTAYRYMLQYFDQSANDPQRQKLYADLLRRTLMLNERLMRSQYELVSTEQYYNVLREEKKNDRRSVADYQLVFETFAEDMAMAPLMQTGERLEEEKRKLSLQHEANQNAFFNKVWTSPVWDAKWYADAQAFLASKLVPVHDVSLFVSAVTMAAMQVFDVQKLQLLMEAYNHEEMEVNQRALTGLVLLCLQYDKRLAFEPEIRTRIDLTFDPDRFRRDLLCIQLQLLLTRETKKADRKMRDEIIPEVIKNSKGIGTSKINILSMDEEGILNDKNPEWQKWSENSGLADKMRELGDMQLEGVDVYMSTFAQLKTFPFFQNVCNWFYPFDMQHSEVTEALKDNKIQPNSVLGGMLATPMFCDSDKYSLCFMLSKMPPAQREVITSNILGSQQEMQMENLIKKPHEDEISRQYIYDLNRFFKIYPRRHEFDDPFEKLSLNFEDCDMLRPYISSLESLRSVAEYLFYKEYYDEALVLYKKIALHEGDGMAEIYQKMGFCYQKSKDYTKAIEAYRQADVRKSDNLWTMRHLAQCYRLVGDPKSALSYYLLALEMQPDNRTLLLQAGECRVRLGQYEDAFANFFKVEYLDSHSLKAWRAIAWCSFLTGKLEQAEKYYSLLLKEEKPEVQDFLNAGHTAWAHGNVHLASERYLTGCRLMGDTEAFIRQIEKDRHDMESQGIQVADLPIMYDLLRYRINQ